MCLYDYMIPGSRYVTCVYNWHILMLEFVCFLFQESWWCWWSNDPPFSNEQTLRFPGGGSRMEPKVFLGRWVKRKGWWKKTCYFVSVWDLFKLMFYFLPWEITMSNHHLGNILYFLQPPEANLSCRLCIYIYILYFMCVWFMVYVFWLMNCILWSFQCTYRNYCI